MVKEKMVVLEFPLQVLATNAEFMDTARSSAPRSEASISWEMEPKLGKSSRETSSSRAMNRMLMRLGT